MHAKSHLLIILTSLSSLVSIAYILARVSTSLVLSAVVPLTTSIGGRDVGPALTLSVDRLVVILLPHLGNPMCRCCLSVGARGGGL